MTKITVLTAGMYSSYGIVGIVQGPDDVSVKDMLVRFLAEYANAKISDYVQYEEREKILERLKSEGVEIFNSPTGYDRNSDYNDDNIDTHFYSWLLVQPGWTRLEWSEVHVDDE